MIHKFYYVGLLKLSIRVSAKQQILGVKVTKLLTQVSPMLHLSFADQRLTLNSVAIKQKFLRTLEIAHSNILVCGKNCL